MKPFTLKWNNARIPNLPSEERLRTREAEGVQFSTGYVALSNGVVWESLADMERHLKAYGTMELTYLEDAHAQAS
jgi:hypothetical protein